MRVNIVTESKEKAWILRRMAEELVQLPDVTIGEPQGADVQMYINYALFNENHPGLKIAYFTHLEAEGIYRKRLFKVMLKCDVAVLMNGKLYSLALKSGKERAWIIPPGTEFKPSKPLVFGVVGRTYPTGRKGERLVQKMVEAGFDVRAWGHGWPCTILGSGVEDIARFYESIDYLVVLSNNEGGPVPVLEAIALKVPVIAPDVGFCWDHPVIRYTRGSWESLNEVLTKLARPRTWEDWREDHRKLFAEIGGLLCKDTLDALSA